MHVWAHPRDGADPIFLGAAPSSGTRPDVGDAFGAQFARSGYGLTVSGLPPGGYQLAVYARSAVTRTFNQAQAVHVTVR